MHFFNECFRGNERISDFRECSQKKYRSVTHPRTLPKMLIPFIPAGTFLRITLAKASSLQMSTMSRYLNQENSHNTCPISYYMYILKEPMR